MQRALLLAVVLTLLGAGSASGQEAVSDGRALGPRPFLPYGPTASHVAEGVAQSCERSTSCAGWGANCQRLNRTRIACDATLTLPPIEEGRGGMCGYRIEIYVDGSLPVEYVGPMWCDLA